MDQCPISCVICAADKNCTECYPGFFRTQPNPIRTCQTVCPSGYYGDITTQDCLPCHSSCKTCSGGAYNQCLTCDTTIYTFMTQKSTCECSANHYYVSGSGCVPCHYSCSNCDSLTSCLSCRMGYFKTSAALCTACEEECESCKSILSCDTCSSSKNRVIQIVSTTVNTCPCKYSSFERSVSAFFDNTLTRQDYYTTSYGSCIACPSGCLECDNELKCTKCVLNDQRILRNDLCVCQQLYKEDPITQLCEKYDPAGAQALKTTMTAVELFEVFDASFIPEIVQEDGHKLRTSNGFYLNEIDGLFIRNSNQYILVFIALALVYAILKIFQKIFLSTTMTKTPLIAPVTSNFTQRKPSQKGNNNNIKPIELTNNQAKYSANKKVISNSGQKEEVVKNNQITPKISNGEKCKKFLKKAIDSFEWGIFLGCLEAAYLNICTFTFLQLQSATLNGGVEYISFFLAFLVLPVLVGFLIAIYQIIMKVLSIRKIHSIFITKSSSSFQPIITTHEEEQIQQEEDQANSSFEKSFAMVYSLFVPGQIIQQGYYLVVATRKFLFAFFLVFAYKTPALILSVWIMLNILMSIILLKYRPYKEIIYTVRDIITEVCFLTIHALTYPLISEDFVYGKDNQEDYQGIGKAIVAFCLIIILVHLISLIYDAIMTLIDFFKPKEPIPPTPIIPSTPTHSPVPEEPIKLTEYQKLKLGLRKQKKYIKVQEIHKDDFVKEMNLEYFDKLQQLENMMNQAQDDQEFDIIKKQYELQLFLINLTNRLHTYVQENPSATIITRQEITSLLPIQLEEFNKKNQITQGDNTKNQESQQQNQNNQAQGQNIQPQQNSSQQNNSTSIQQGKTDVQNQNGLPNDQNQLKNQINQNLGENQQNQPHNVNSGFSVGKPTEQVDKVNNLTSQTDGINQNYPYQENITMTMDNNRADNQDLINNGDQRRQSQGNSEKIGQLHGEQLNFDSKLEIDQNQQGAIQRGQFTFSQQQKLNETYQQNYEFSQPLSQQQRQSLITQQQIKKGLNSNEEISQEVDIVNLNNLGRDKNISQQSSSSQYNPRNSASTMLQIIQAQNNSNQQNSQIIQEPRRRRYQRQINPINATRLENIDNALKKLNN